MAGQIIPLTSSPNQTVRVDLSVDGSTLTLTLKIFYNEISSYWCMSILDTNGNLLLDSVPMLSGVWPASNILGQYGYLQIGSAYLINVSGVSEDNPTASNLGSDWQLLWSDTAS